MNANLPADRNHDPATNAKMERWEKFAHDTALQRELKQRTKLNQPPSQHIQAWREYERAFFFDRGLHPSPALMGYNLWTDSAGLLRWAHQVLTDDVFSESTGFHKPTIPRRALAVLCKAFGYRYLRGLEVFEGRLNGGQHARFLRERMTFRREFEQRADVAHSINDKGQNPDAALQVVQMFAQELLALSLWLEQIGESADAVCLCEAVSEAMTLVADVDR